MSHLTIFTNPKKRDIDLFIRRNKNIQAEIRKLIEQNNVRVEIKRHDQYTLLVFYIPEYLNATRKITSVEINAYYDRSKNEATLFAFNTNHFFTKYEEQLRQVTTKSFSAFLEAVLTIILEDEARIIEHILVDTRELKEEYASLKDSTILIRHLTNNLTNITTLKLLLDNQNQLLDKVEEHIRNYEDSIINLQRDYISQELHYAKEYCETLMTSINTKYQVRMTDILYEYTRYTFIIFLTGVVFQVIYAYRDDPSPLKFTFWIAMLTTALGALLMLRRF